MIKKEERLNYKLDNGVLEIKLVGEIDHHNAVKLRADADNLIKQFAPERVALDLSAISFMDSSGLGFIMGRASLVQKLGGSLTVKNPSAGVRKICYLAGLERIINFEK